MLGKLNVHPALSFLTAGNVGSGGFLGGAGQPGAGAVWLVGSTGTSASPAF